jgi:hypothetical protein
MKRKCTLCITFILLITQFSFAQIRFPVPTGIRADLQKVVDEYPAQFAAIRGEVVDRNPQSTEYRSKVKVANAPQCSIIAYSSGSKPVYSWQALVYATEEYDAAAKKYRWLYQQIKGANLFYLKDQYTLRGSYQEADESRGFAVSTLALVSPPTAYQKLRVDVSMQFEFPEWKVQLLVYDKEREDSEAGPEDE